MATVPPGAKPEEIDGAWTAAGFVFDNRRNTVTAYLNGVAEEYWISDPREHRFYRWVYRAWLQARLHEIPGLQEGEDPDFPPDQHYSPPEKRWLERKVLSETPETRVELRRYPFTEVQVTLQKDATGKFRPVGVPHLVRLKVNPFWFPHDLYSPPDATQGGPFTPAAMSASRATSGAWRFSIARSLPGTCRSLPPSALRRRAAARTAECWKRRAYSPKALASPEWGLGADGG